MNIKKLLMGSFALWCIICVVTSSIDLIWTGDAGFLFNLVWSLTWVVCFTLGYIEGYKHRSEATERNDEKK